MTALADRTVGGLATALAARSPTPGGGAAAAAAAAFGCAAGAMAARYTTGPKWADRAEVATSLADGLDRAAARLLALADEDEAAFAAAQAARKSGDAAAAARADAQAATVPMTVIALCAEQAAALAAFQTRCNPNLLSDVRVGIHLLAGAARAAWATVLANGPSADVRAEAERLLTKLRRAEEPVG
jgi:formiminotetrahydrofolate cyclodeaminase